MTSGTTVRRLRAEAIATKTARRIARSRELVRMWRQQRPCIAGGADERTIRDRVRAALRDGTLGRVGRARVWAGYGTEHPCHVCGNVIRARDIEHEVVDTGGPVLVHATCLRIWHEESLAF